MTTGENARAPARIAVDAMGGDHAPAEIVRGAIDAARKGGVAVALVGQPDALEPHLAGTDLSRLPLEVVPSEGVIAEEEAPATALRQKPRASIPVSVELVRRGKAGAVVTMGSTGAAMAASAVALGTMDGVDRPALGGPVLGLAPNMVVVDLGTSVDCRPGQLLAFGVLGAVMARTILGVGEPRVGLLSVGAEEGKGNRQVKEAYGLLRSAGLNFVGNLEGHDLPARKADVVVCDGFVGNVLMKYSEGLGTAVSRLAERRLAERLPAEAAAEFARELYGLTNVVERHGGGPLLGVRGVVVVGHGRAGAAQVARAVELARVAAESGFVSSMEGELARARGEAQA